jgi:hypothetical protein
VKFCGGCGAASAASPAAAAPRFTSPETYIPKHLAEKILTSKAALEGERKQVTVLFADLKGSMELLADRDPEEARKLLDPVLQRMMEAVHRYEGTVNQVMGDGIMDLFGAPLAHEDHAVRACYAALRHRDHDVPRHGHARLAGAGGRGAGGAALVTEQLPLYELQDLAHRAPYLRHEGGGQASQWASYETPIVDRSQLVHEQIGRLPQTSRRRDPYAKRLGVVDQARGERDDQGRWVIGIEQRLRLDDEDGPSLARLGSPTGIEAGQPHLTPAKASGARSMAANSALTFMLWPRTLRDASASRRARSRACVSRFMRSTARRIYAARDSFSATAQRVLAFSRSSGSLRDMALIGIPQEYLDRVCIHDISPVRVTHTGIAIAMTRTDPLMPAGELRARCLQVMRQVERPRRAVTITKRGRPRESRSPVCARRARRLSAAARRVIGETLDHPDDRVRHLYAQLV